MARGWGPVRWFERVVEAIRARLPLLALLLALNLWGIVYGFYFYRRQLPETPWFLLPLVPDSPLAVLLLSAALVAWRFGGRRWDTLDALAAGANVKVGAWTVFVLLFHRDAYFLDFPWSPTTQFLLLVGHAGMVLEALVLLPRLARSLAAQPWTRAVTVWAVPLGLFLLNDMVDYGLGHHPSVPERGLDVVERVSYALTGLTVLLGFAMVAWTQRGLGLERKRTAA